MAVSVGDCFPGTLRINGAGDLGGSRRAVAARRGCYLLRVLNSALAEPLIRVQQSAEGRTSDPQRRVAG